jgi:hypothetical protein
MTLGDLRAAIERLPLFDRGNGPDEGDPDRYTVSQARVLELIDRKWVRAMSELAGEQRAPEPNDSRPSDEPGELPSPEFTSVEEPYPANPWQDSAESRPSDGPAQPSGPSDQLVRARNSVLAAAGNHEVMHRRGEWCGLCKAVLRYRAARAEARS